jgi:glycerol-3-phosphate acyltransferase PlsY
VSALAVLILAGSYLIGSIPFSYLVARRAGVDLRQVGSGNVGATNVMRSAGRKAGILAFLLDASKGAVAALLAGRLSPGDVLPPLAAACAVLGHMYPVWLGFRGGKGVATGAGAFLPLAPLATLFALLAFAVTLVSVRYVSIASLLGAVALVVTAFVSGAPPPVAWTAAGLTALIVWKHRGNLQRIRAGTENRLRKGLMK